jgi:hypothetical protein
MHAREQYLEQVWKEYGRASNKEKRGFLNQARKRPCSRAVGDFRVRMWAAAGRGDPGPKFHACAPQVSSATLGHGDPFALPEDPGQSSRRVGCRRGRQRSSQHCGRSTGGQYIHTVSARTSGHAAEPVQPVQAVSPWEPGDGAPSTMFLRIPQSTCRGAICILDFLPSARVTVWLGRAATPKFVTTKRPLARARRPGETQAAGGPDPRVPLPNRCSRWLRQYTRFLGDTPKPPMMWFDPKGPGAVCERRT